MIAALTKTEQHNQHMSISIMTSPSMFKKHFFLFFSLLLPVGRQNFADSRARSIVQTIVTVSKSMKQDLNSSFFVSYAARSSRFRDSFSSRTVRLGRETSAFPLLSEPKKKHNNSTNNKATSFLFSYPCRSSFFSGATWTRQLFFQNIRNDRKQQNANLSICYILWNLRS